MSLSIGGILVMVAGSFFVNTVGLTDTCSNELTSKGVEYAPIIIGGIMSWIGRYRLGGVTWYGARKN